VGDTTLFPGPLPQEVVASVFANRELYLILANYGQKVTEVMTRETFVPTDGPAASSARRWSLPPRSLKILRRLV
jgi:hypothetical protein